MSPLCRHLALRVCFGKRALPFPGVIPLGKPSGGGLAQRGTLAGASPCCFLVLSGQVTGGPNYCCTFTWKPAAFNALTNSAASKFPLTVNEVALALAVSLLTPSTFLTVFLMAALQVPQQL